MKGIILAGGSGTRLHPLTVVISKQLLPLYDKPLIYYPLSTLMSAGIREILIITTPDDLTNFKKLLGNGSDYGIDIQYETQKKPEGIAQALIIGEKFINKEPFVLILGDNVFFGNKLDKYISKAYNEAKKGKSTIFGYRVQNPERFGVIEFDKNGKVLSIEEKPMNPKSNYCVTGLYCYDGRAPDFAKKIKPSERGELEITDLNNMYLKENDLNVKLLDCGFSWMDTGTFDNMLEASNYIHEISTKQNTRIFIPEEIAFNKGWIDANKLLECAKKYSNSEYGKHLKEIAGK